MVDIPPEAVQMGFNIAELMVRNTASSVMDRVRVAKSNRDKSEQVEVLTQIINELIEDNNELKTVAQAQQEQLVSQNISSDELHFINETLIPAVEQIMQLGESGDQQEQKGIDSDGGMNNEVTTTSEQMEAIKTLVAPEMLSVLQLVGFNFRQAIGEPLTDVVRSLVQGLVPQQDVDEMQLSKLLIERDILIYKASSDGAAYARLKKMGIVPEEAEDRAPKRQNGHRRK